jgi:putative glycosyltransferase (TIGR04348 family)
MRILRELGHDVRIANRYRGQAADLMIALHAWRSSEAIRAFRGRYPERPLIVALSGTDIYDYIERDPTPTLNSLACADRLVALQPLARRRVPVEFRRKVRVVYQSARDARRSDAPTTRSFEIAVIGHLRGIKDPLRAARAARHLPAASRIRIVHLGAAETPRFTALAMAEMKINPRYIWRGDKPQADVRRLLGRARAIVLSSVSEGGANVISEAVAAGVPVLATRIDGSVGLLGPRYPGYFSVGDTAALTDLLNCIETRPEFLARLRQAVLRRAHLFRPEREKAAWKRLLGEVTALLRAPVAKQQDRNPLPHASPMPLRKSARAP